jgi:hypothetical protein
VEEAGESRMLVDKGSASWIADGEWVQAVTPMSTPLVLHLDPYISTVLEANGPTLNDMSTCFPLRPEVFKLSRHIHICFLLVI